MCSIARADPAYPSFARIEQLATARRSTNTSSNLQFHYLLAVNGGTCPYHSREFAFVHAGRPFFSWEPIVSFSPDFFGKRLVNLELYPVIYHFPDKKWSIYVYTSIRSPIISDHERKSRAITEAAPW